MAEEIIINTSISEPVIQAESDKEDQTNKEEREVLGISSVALKMAAYFQYEEIQFCLAAVKEVIKRQLVPQCFLNSKTTG